MDTVVFELFNLVEVVLSIDVEVVVVVVLEDPTKPLRMLMINGSSGDTVEVVVDFVVNDVVVNDVDVNDFVAGEIVVNFSFLLCSLLLFGIFVAEWTKTG